jgi:hypothetical protein
MDPKVDVLQILTPAPQRPNDRLSPLLPPSHSPPLPPLRVLHGTSTREKQALPGWRSALARALHRPLQAAHRLLSRLDSLAWALHEAGWSWPDPDPGAWERLCEETRLLDLSLAAQILQQRGTRSSRNVAGRIRAQHRLLLAEYVARWGVDP